MLLTMAFHSLLEAYKICTIWSYPTTSF
uniref:LRR-RLK n=1 Tax=Rhizophora mucronata TaxID=61149 RepID=A0A2P2KB73_RHIMU